MTTYEILMIVITAAVVILVFALVALVVKLWKTLGSVQRQLDELGNRDRGIIHNINELTADINFKMKCFDPFFRALSNIGEGVECKSEGYKDKIFWKCLRDKLEIDEAPKRDDTASQIVDMALLGVNIWKNIKARR